MSPAQTVSPRIKICGLTRPEDVDGAVALGVDAIGLVFYPPSPRGVTPALAADLARRVPPFTSVVGLFVNPEPAWVAAVREQVPLDLLQFHGEETADFCASFGLPYLKAARVRPGLDLVQYRAQFPKARALLLDAFVDGYGGGGKTFDWSLIPPGFARQSVLSGGLDADNVAAAIRALAPAAVDVSSGVEAAKGIKDPARMAAFVAAVRTAWVGV